MTSGQALVFQHSWQMPPLTELKTKLNPCPESQCKYSRLRFFHANRKQRKKTSFIRCLAPNQFPPQTPWMQVTIGTAAKDINNNELDEH